MTDPVPFAALGLEARLVAALDADGLTTPTPVQAALLPVMQVHAALVAVTDWDGQHPADSGCYWVVSTDRPLPQCQGGPVGRLQEMGMPHAARG